MKTSCVILSALAGAALGVLATRGLIDNGRAQEARENGERMIRLIQQAGQTDRRLAAVAMQNVALTSQTLAIMDRLAPAPGVRVCHDLDEPLVLYEARPEDAKSKRKYVAKNAKAAGR